VNPAQEALSGLNSAESSLTETVIVAEKKDLYQCCDSAEYAGSLLFRDKKAGCECGIGFIIPSAVQAVSIYAIIEFRLQL